MPLSAPGLMGREIAESPEVARRLLAEPEPMRRLARSMRDDGARTCVTIARGSSDHAAHHFAALMARLTGRWIASMPPSWTTVLQSPWPPGRWRPLAFSQSGRSPDLIATVQALDPQGLWSAAFVNETESPLASAARFLVPLKAGPEQSVAATKSVVAQLVAGAMLVDACVDPTRGHHELRSELERLPDALDRTLRAPPWPIDPSWLDARHVLVIGRAQALPIAQEIALKLKETSLIHAEAVSAAELRHGPQAIVGAGVHALLVAPDALTEDQLRDTAEHLRHLGATVHAIGRHGWCDLQVAPHGLELCAGVPVLAQAYPWIEGLSRALGRDPDRPRHLSKVTLTR